MDHATTEPQPIARHRPITPQAARRLEDWRAKEEQRRGVPSAAWPEAVTEAHRAAAAAELTIADQRKRGKAVLEELLPLLMGMVAMFQPWPPPGRNPLENRALFERYVVLTIKCAEAVAPYQSPKAIIVKDERRPEDEPPDLTKLTDEELREWRRLLIKAQRGPTIEAE